MKQYMRHLSAASFLGHDTLMLTLEFIVDNQDSRL